MKPRLLDLFCGADGAAIKARFWSYVDKRERHECWPWTGATRGNGYGQLAMRPLSPQKAHRVSFVLAWGWEPNAVLHKCDNPICVNPRHLFGGTQADNMRDAAAKLRTRAKVTPAVKSTILAMHEAGCSHRVIGRQVGLHHSTVGRTIRDYIRAAA